MLFKFIGLLILAAMINVPSMSSLPDNSTHSYKFSPYPHSFFSADQPSISKRAANRRLSKNFIGDDGRVYACSGKNFFSFEKNGSIAWTLHLNYTCNPNIAPVHGGSTKIYLVAENRVLKIYPLRIGTSEAAVQVFFGPRQGAQGLEGEITGISASTSSSRVLINIKNRGLFAYRSHGKLLWSAGPVLYQHGYRQGCRKNITDCYFTSVPVIDHCEASIFISNTVGELYSLSVRGPYFKWIQDLSSFGNAFTVTPGHNGHLFVTIPDRGLILALDVSTGNILWQGSIGPLSSADYEPVVDANGWISFGSLDGFLYSFSPTGTLKKFPGSTASWSSVIQVNPVLDCSGYAVYISRTEMEGKTSQMTVEYTHVSALKPKTVALLSLIPASGAIYWFESDTSKFLLKLSQSDLQHFVLDETTLLAFFAVSRNGNPLPCRSTRQKLASSCSQVKPKIISMYTGNERTIILFLLIESVLVVLLTSLLRYCCIFWTKKKLQGLDLGTFLEKRHCLQSKKKEFDRMIIKLENKVSDNDEVLLEKLSDFVKKREDVSRKLSTTYSLGRDGEKQVCSKSLLPLYLYDGKTRSYSFRGSNKESVTIFQTLISDESTNTSTTATSDDDDDVSENEDEIVDVDDDVKAKGKARVEVESSSDDENEPSASQGFVDHHSLSEIEEVIKRNDDDDDYDDKVVRNRLGKGRSLRRRTVS